MHALLGLGKRRMHFRTVRLFAKGLQKCRTRQSICHVKHCGNQTPVDHACAPTDGEKKRKEYHMWCALIRYFLHDACIINQNTKEGRKKKVKEEAGAFLRVNTCTCLFVLCLSCM